MHQELSHHPFGATLDRCDGNTLNDLTDRICVLNKTEYINLNVFNMITQNIHHATGNVNLTVRNIIQIKNGIIESVNMSVKIQ